jgi:hypothetical protein
MTVKELKEKFPALVSAIVTFSGSGDEGNCEVEEVIWENDDNEFDIENDLIDIGYDILEDHYRGWEINDGSDGRISINFETSKCVVNYSELVWSDDVSKEIDLEE